MSVDALTSLQIWLSSSAPGLSSLECLSKTLNVLSITSAAFSIRKESCPFWLPSGEFINLALNRKHSTSSRNCMKFVSEGEGLKVIIRIGGDSSTLDWDEVFFFF